MKGSPSSSNREISSRSAATSARVASVTSTATSQVRRVSRVRSTRRAPSSPTSSIPGVSTISTGPSGRSSIALRTGSVVVPATSLTSATCCPHTAFTRLDLPALRTPKNPIRTRSPEGVSFKPMLEPSFRLAIAARLAHRPHFSARCGSALPAPLARSRTACATNSRPSRPHAACRPRNFRENLVRSANRARPYARPQKSPQRTGGVVSRPRP